MAASQPARVPAFVGLLNPLARRLLRAGPLLGPNALITVRGRKTGEPRTTPVALVEIGGGRWVIGTFGETNWVRNLRAAGRATISAGKKREEVAARELAGEERATFFRDVLAPYARRIPLGSTLLAMLGAGDVVKDPVAASANRPVFELRAA